MVERKEEIIIMSTKKNDERVLQLKSTIDQKRAELNAIKRFTPVTNCILDLDDHKYNLNVLQQEDLKMLLVKLNMYQMSATALEIDLDISGYKLTDWISDVRSKIDIFDRRKKESDLKALEAKLDAMLSDEKKTELELDEIAALLE